jgi:hypothetical protein
VQVFSGKKQKKILTVIKTKESKNEEEYFYTRNCQSVHAGSPAGIGRCPGTASQSESRLA